MSTEQEQAQQTGDPVKTDIVVVKIPLNDIFVNEEFNCRGQIAPIDVVDLVDSIKRKGLLQPVVVQPITTVPGKKYLLLAGYRRATAYRVMSEDLIPAIIREPMSEVEARLLNLTENLQRQELTISQEAKALKKLYDLKLGRDTVAKALNKSGGWVQARMNLLDLPSEVQAAVEAGAIPQVHIRDLHTIYKKSKLSEPEAKLLCISEANKIKEARDKGQIHYATKKKTDYKSKRIRTRGEIYNMIEYLSETAIGMGPYTRAMAWCAGNITTEELYEDFAAYAIANGLEYTMPREEDLEPKLPETPEPVEG